LHPPPLLIVSTHTHTATQRARAGGRWRGQCQCDATQSDRLAVLFGGHRKRATVDERAPSEHALFAADSAARETRHANRAMHAPRTCACVRSCVLWNARAGVLHVLKQDPAGKGTSAPRRGFAPGLGQGQGGSGRRPHRYVYVFYYNNRCGDSQRTLRLTGGVDGKHIYTCTHACPPPTGSASALPAPKTPEANKNQPRQKEKTNVKQHTTNKEKHARNKN